MARTHAGRGFTLVELMVVLAITGVIMAAVVVSIRDIARTNSARILITEIQGEGRTGLYRMQEDIREASLGSQAGAVFDVTLAGVEPRPAVQLFDNVPGGVEWLDVKPGTDALLVVSAGVRLPVFDPVAVSWSLVPVEASVTEANFDPVGIPLKVTDVQGFREGQSVLIGSFKSAGWFTIGQVTGVAGSPGELTLAAAANNFPGGGAEVGALVRAAYARLYYVNVNDELAVRELLVPRAPGTAQEMRGPEVIARGIENLQLDCQLDGGDSGYFEGCPAVLAAGNSIQVESVPSGLVNPRLDGTTVSGLRSISVSTVIRSRRPLVDEHGEPAVAVGNEPALVRPSGPDVFDPDAEYERRSYRMAVGVRNTSLGNL